METVQKNEFVALKYTGYANGVLFDSNEEAHIKQIHPQAEARELILVVGKGMIVPGLDKALEGKEIGKSYEITLSAREGFGERRRDLVKTIPLKVFTEKEVHPYPGLVLTMDDMVVKILTISGARVITDFNNPLAGKELKYTFRVTRKVTDETEKARALFEVSFKGVPEFEVKDTIVVKGPKILEVYAKGFSSVFKELMGKELSYEFKELPSDKKRKAVTDEHAHSHEGHNHSHEGHEHHKHDEHGN